MGGMESTHTTDWLEYTPEERQATANFLEAEVGTLEGMKETVDDAMNTMRSATVEIYSLRAQVEEKDAENIALKEYVLELQHDLDAAIKECADQHGEGGL